MLTLLLLWFVPLLVLLAGLLWLAFRPARPGMRTGLETQWGDPTPDPCRTCGRRSGHWTGCPAARHTTADEMVRALGGEGL